MADRPSLDSILFGEEKKSKPDLDSILFGSSEAAGAREAAASRVAGAVKPGRGRGQTPNMLPDMLKSLTSGVAEGVIGTAAREGQAELAQQSGGAPTGAPSAEQAIERFQPHLYQSQSGFGDASRTAGKFAGDPISYAGPELAGAGAGLSSLVKGGSRLMGLAGASGLGSYFGGQIGGKPGEIIGGGIGALGSSAAGGAARSMMPRATPEQQALVRTLREQHGIEPHAGDVANSPWLRRAQRGGDAPFGGQSFEGVATPPLEQFTAELAQSFGQNTNRITPVVFQQAHQDIGAKFEAALPNMPVMDYAPRAPSAASAKSSAASGKMPKGGSYLGNDFNAIKKEMNDKRVDPDVFKKISNLIDNVMDGFVTKDKGPSAMTGEKFHELIAHDSDIRYAQREGGLTGHYANRVEEALYEAATRSARRSGARKEALASFEEARKQYANLLMVESGYAKQSAQVAGRGLVEPETMRQVLTGGEANKHRYAKDTHDLGPLVRDASAVISRYRQETPFEHSAPWSIPGAVAGGAGYLATGNPWLAAKLAAGGALAAGPMGRTVNRPGVQKMLKEKAMKTGGPDWYELMRKAGRGAATALYEE